MFWSHYYFTFNFRATYQLQSILLWNSLQILLSLQQPQTGRCTLLLGTYVVHGSSVTHTYFCHNTLAHPFLCHCHSLGSHLDLSTWLLVECLTTQCSWGCRNPQQMLVNLLCRCWLCSPLLYNKIQTSKQQEGNRGGGQQAPGVQPNSNASRVISLIRTCCG